MTGAGRDRVVLAMQAAAVALSLVVVALAVPLAHRVVAVATKQCPAPDHAMWADSLGPWWWRGEAICGTGQTIGFKSVSR